MLIAIIVHSLPRAYGSGTVPFASHLTLNIYEALGSDVTLR